MGLRRLDTERRQLHRATQGREVRRTSPGLALIIALSGDASPMAQQKLQAAGINLAMRLAPGPLK